MKTTLDLRPIFHRREDRIRAHVLLCWLSLLLIRIAENATGETWRTIRTELDKLHLGRFAGPAGEVSQRTETTPRQAAIFTAAGVAEPHRFFGLAPTQPAATACPCHPSRSTDPAHRYRREFQLRNPGLMIVGRNVVPRGAAAGGRRTRSLRDRP
jgi:hypothetical protein